MCLLTQTASYDQLTNLDLAIPFSIMKKNGKTLMQASSALSPSFFDSREEYYFGMLLLSTARQR